MPTSPPAVVRRCAGLLVLAACVAPARSAEIPADPALERLVADRHAIEMLEWQRRTWPEGNTRAKPAIDVLAPRAATREKVDAELRQITALRALCGVAIGTGEMQAELDRIAASTRDPAALERFFAALGDDPQRVGAAIVRPLLVAHALRRCYADDPRWHQGVLDDARRGFDALEAGADPATLGATHRIVRHRADEDGWSRLLRVLAPEAVEGSDRARLAALADGRWLGPVDRPQSAIVLRVVEHDARGLVLESLGWPKVPFDAWWNAHRAEFAAAAPAVASGRLVLPAIGGTRPSRTPSSCPPEAWSPMRSTLPLSRQNHTAVWTGADMIVWGGEELDLLDDGERYPAATNSWSPLSRAGAPSARSNHLAVWTGPPQNLMLVWGGGPSSGARYAPGADAWTPMSQAGAPPGGVGATAVWTGTEMIVWGGTPFSAARYNPSTDAWTPVSGAGAPTPRSGHAAVWTGSAMIVWGGTDGGGVVKTGGIYNPVSDTWTSMDSGEAPSKRTHHAAAWSGTRMYVHGGLDASNATRSDGGVYDPATNSWTSLPLSGAPALHDHRAVWSTATNELLVVGSNVANAHAFGARYAPATNTWRPMSGALAPNAGIGHTAVWSGTAMIVWGGNYFGAPDDDGGRYDPATDAWTKLAYTTAPGDRAHAGAVFTGNEWTIWSGYDLFEYWIDGADYQPVLDAWLPFDAPTFGRLDPAAVWTGTTTLFWGGMDPSGHFVTDGINHPPNGQASSLTYVLAPSPRSGFAAAWVRDRMVVWGGVSDAAAGGQFLDDGGRYDPATDQWDFDPLATAGAPSPRANFAFAATGTRMIVWGGDTNSDGAIYDLATNTWSPMSSAGAPAPRSGPLTAWTGTSMLVWGGSAPGGGRYDLASDSWSAITNNGAPMPVPGSRAAWNPARHEMLVWGGGNGTPLPRGGSIYDADGDAWRPMLEAGAPAGRTNFGLAWDPNTMTLLVFGGNGPYAPESHGGGIYTVPPGTAVNPFLAALRGAAGTVHLYWPAIGTTYDVVRGGLAALRASDGNFTTSLDACLTDDTPASSVDDAAAPPGGDGFYYVLRAASCAGAGTYDSGSTSQVASRDAEIAAAPAACP